MNYGYIRVSTTQQNIARQLEELKNIEDLPDENIYIDKQSGKDFNRESYKKLMNTLQKDDTLFIKSIDRLGRNYTMIIEEWSKITKEIEANIVVLDMPLLDTRTTPKNLIGKFIGDIVLQLLSFVAETERENIKQRQAEGIRIALANGTKFGRRKICLTKNELNTIKKYENKRLNLKETLKELSMPKSTFYLIYNEYKNNQLSNRL